MNLEFFNIENYLQDEKIPYHTEGKNISNGWIGIHCPWCFPPDPSNHLGINLKSKSISCWKCGNKGTIIKLIMKLTPCIFKEAIQIIQKYSSTILPQNQEIIYKKQEIFTPFEKLSDNARNYLIGRKFDPDEIEYIYKISDGGIIGNYKFRIIIPYYQKRTQVTFNTRDYTNLATSKYKMCSQNESILTPHQTLYNIDSCSDTILVVEGPTDVWRIGKGCIALSGKICSASQMKLLRNFKRIFIMLDADAIEQTQKLALTICNHVQYCETIILNEGDPGDLPSDAIKELRKFIFNKIY